MFLPGFYKVFLSLSSSFLVPPAPPSIYAYSTSSTSLMVNWTRVDYNENITAYVVFYRKFLKEGKNSENGWNRIATAPDVGQTHITGLQEDTLYTLRVVASSKFANGISSPYFDCRTSEGGKICCGDLLAIFLNYHNILFYPLL